MADAMEALKGILGDDAEDKIKNVMNSLSGGDTGDENLEYAMQLRDIMSKLANDRHDPRSNLLMSLKPYMRTSRRKSIDNAVRLLSLTRLTGLMRKK